MRNETRHHRPDVRRIALALWVLVAGAQAEAARGGSAGATKVLQFPRDQYVGSLYAEDPCLGSTYAELGRDLSLPYGLDPRRLALGGDWDFIGFAQGDARVPAGRNIELRIMLRPRKEDAGRLATLRAEQYKMYVAERCPEDPLDLSGLSGLEPNDLYCLSVSSLLARADADQCVLKAVRHLTGLKILKLHGTGVTDKGMEYLRELRSLRAFEFYSESAIGNPGLAVLKDLPSLEYLDLGTGATDEGFKHLGQFPSLRWLRIQTGRIWGPGLAELAHLPRLERLCLWGTSPLSDRHLQYLEGLTHLKSLSLWGEATERLTDASLASIGKLRSLEELHFVGWSAPAGFTPKGVACLKNLKNLKKVDFGLAWCGPKGVAYGDDVARLLAEMPGLESIQGIGYLSAEGMKTLARMRNLKCLHVALKDRHQGYYGPTGVSYLAGLDALEDLAFTGGQSLSDADLAQLESLGSLRHLMVGFSETTDRGMASLGKLRRLEHLTIGGDCRVSKRGLNELNGLTNLQTLCVRPHSDGKAAADEIPLNLSALANLKTFHLSGFALEDGDLACLSGLARLEVIMLQSQALPEAALRPLKDLPALKRVDIGAIDCSDGSGLAGLAGLTGLRDLTLRGRITDRAFAQLATVTSAWSISAWTNEPIAPQTIACLKQSLPALEYIHLCPLPEFNKPKARPAPGPQSPGRSSLPPKNRPAPARPRRPR